MTENEAIKAIQNDLEWHSKELKPAYKEVLKMAIQALEEIQQYRAIETVEKCRVAVERMKPKKPFFNGENYECPNCYTRPYADDAEDKKPMLCDICGQILDWQ